MVVTHYTAARRWTFQLHKECDQNNEESRGGLGMNKICVFCESVLICVYMFIYMSVHSITFYPAPTFSENLTLTVGSYDNSLEKSQRLSWLCGGLHSRCCTALQSFKLLIS